MAIDAGVDRSGDGGPDRTRSAARDVPPGIGTVSLSRAADLDLLEAAPNPSIVTGRSPGCDHSSVRPGTTVAPKSSKIRRGRRQPSHAISGVVTRPERPHIAVQQTDLHWRPSMTDFGPALALYVVTAAISITMALAWVV